MVLVDIYVKKDSKDDLVDLFLYNEINDFFFFETNKYASKYLLVSDKERVSGRMEYYLCKIYTTKECSKDLISLVMDNIKEVQIFTSEFNKIV